MRTRRGHHDWTHRFKSIAAALPSRSAVNDGEAVVLDARWQASFPPSSRASTARAALRSFGC